MERRILDLGCGNGGSTTVPKRAWLNGGILKAMRAEFPGDSFLTLGLDRFFVTPDFTVPGCEFVGRTEPDCLEGSRFDAILWRYPNPADIFEPGGLQELENSFLGLATQAVRENLIRGGRFFFETDIGRKPFAPHFSPDALRHIRQAIQHCAFLVEKGPFRTHDPDWEELRFWGRRYLKNSLASLPNTSPRTL